MQSTPYRRTHWYPPASIDWISAAIDETSLQPPVDVYGEYEMPNGLEESKEGTETPFSEMPPEDDEDEDKEG